MTCNTNLWLVLIVFKTYGYKSYFSQKGEINFPNPVAKYMVKFNPNVYSNNIWQKYLKIYGQTLAKNGRLVYNYVINFNQCSIDITGSLKDIITIY